jgi:hypothetical protein
MPAMSNELFGNEQGFGDQSRRQRDPARARRAAEDQVALMHLKLDVRIDPVAWRLFLRVYFDRMSTLAHTIHDNEE